MIWISYREIIVMSVTSIPSMKMAIEVVAERKSPRNVTTSKPSTPMYRGSTLVNVGVLAAA